MYIYICMYIYIYVFYIYIYDSLQNTLGAVSTCTTSSSFTSILIPRTNLFLQS